MLRLVRSHTKINLSLLSNIDFISALDECFCSEKFYANFYADFCLKLKHLPAANMTRCGPMSSLQSCILIK